MTPAVYTGVTAHARVEPLASKFRYRTSMWLVDLDELPTLPRALRWAASFRAEDHIGDPTKSLRDNITVKFAEAGIDVSDCRLLMLAHARGLGYVFNPISIHWAIDSLGQVRAVIAEVHNTYGGRFGYVLRLDDKNRADVDKELFVSPFYGTDGSYTIRVSPPDKKIAVTVTLHPEHGHDFVATLNAIRQPTTSLPVAAVRSAAAARRTAFLIRVQGIKLWARRLKIVDRPAGHDRELTLQPKKEAVAP